MNADESVSSGRGLIHVFGDVHEALGRFDFSAFIGVHRRLNCRFWVYNVPVINRRRAFLAGINRTHQ